MRINQIWTATSLRHFDWRMKKKYGLVQYNTDTDPAIFYGLFSSTIPVLQAHKSSVVIIWAGTDAQMLRGWRLHGKPFAKCQQVDRILQRSNVYHICRSRQLAKDLDLCGLPYRFERVSPVLVGQFEVGPLGPCVYSYGSDRCREKYGGHIVDELKVRFPNVKFLSYDPVNIVVPYDCIANVYSRCFLNLRLTKHDGFPNSVLEMGLMGRPSVFNGDIPGAIPWRSTEDVASAIDAHVSNVGCCGDTQLSDSIRNELSISDDWLDTDMYGG